jgi:hypothetical protein
MFVKRGPVARFGVVAFALALLVACRPAWPGAESTPTAPAVPAAEPELGGDEAHEIVTVFPRDSIQAIDEPAFYDILSADLAYAADEWVLGVSLGPEARAYSIPVLTQHEIVNDTVAGRPIALTWCPLCNIGIVYSREIDGQTYAFGVSGQLLDNVLVMYDRQTGSLWSQLLGRAVEGELAGTELEYLTSELTTWAEWKARYPHTLALVKGSPPPDPRNGAERYDPLWAREYVVGVELDGESVAYPWRVLSTQPAIDDLVAGQPLLILFSAAEEIGVVFDRRLGERTLTFSLFDRAPLLLRDGQTGSSWSGLEGLALEGPLAGERLRPVEHTNLPWSAWLAARPGTRIYGLEK